VKEKSAHEVCAELRGFLEIEAARVNAKREKQTQQNQYLINMV
jgi:hypothetical protein